MGAAGCFQLNNELRYTTNLRTRWLARLAHFPAVEVAAAVVAVAVLAAALLLLGPVAMATPAVHHPNSGRKKAHKKYYLKARTTLKERNERASGDWGLLTYARERGRTHNQRGRGEE